MKRRPARSAPTRERERDLKDMITQLKRTDARVAEALVTVLRRADPHVLVAFGVLLEFVARRLRRWTR
jgi:hypothetical protein